MKQMTFSAMAYGIKKITGTYQSNGTGRDWFFMGDFEYRHGRRTPPPNVLGQRPEKPPMQPRGPPVEIHAARQRMEGTKSSQAEKWLRRSGSSNVLKPSASEPAMSTGTPKSSLSWKEASQRAAGRRKSFKAGLTGKGGYEPTSWKYGSIPDWPEPKYQLERAEENKVIGVPRGPCAADETAGPGDHTRGIRGSAPHFVATSHSLGQVECPLDKRVCVEIAEVNRAARVHEADKNFKRQEGDLSLGIVGKEGSYKSTMSDLGQYQGFSVPEWGTPDKYHFLPDAMFFDKPDLQAKKSQEGDHCLGIKVKKPHYVSTYSELGNIPGWPKKRYDFGVIADTRYRFTKWRE